MLGGGTATLDEKDGCWKTMSGNRTILWKTQSYQCENFYNHITPKSWLPNSPNYNPLDYYVWGTIKGETSKTLNSTKDELKAKITAPFINLKSRSSERLERDSKITWSWSQWQFLWINWIYSISRYFHLILVNISDNMRCQYYSNFCIN